MSIVLTDGTDTAVANGGVALTQDAWYHAFISVDRDDSSGIRCNVNAGADISTADPTAVDSCTKLIKFTIADRADLFSVGTKEGAIAYAAMWVSASWLDHSDTTEVDAIAAERFKIITGGTGHFDIL